MRPIKECYQHKNKFQINGICANTLIKSKKLKKYQQIVEKSTRNVNIKEPKH